MHRKKLIDTAMGRNDADIILKNGNVVDVFCGSVKKADVLKKTATSAVWANMTAKMQLTLRGNLSCQELLTHICILNRQW